MTARDVLTLGLHANSMLVGASDDIDRTADQRLQRLRAAAKIVDGDVEALLSKIAEPLAKGQRQIIECRLAAHPKRDLLLLESLAIAAPDRKRERERENAACDPSSHLPFRETQNRQPHVRVSATTGRHTSSRRSASVTSQSIKITNAVSTTMPANTPATSNTPSACWMT